MNRNSNSKRKDTRTAKAKTARNYKDKDRLTDTGGLSKADRADERDMRDCYKSKANSPEWYAQNPELMRNYASFPFGQPLGNVLPAGLQWWNESPHNGAAVPGLMALYFVPTVGQATDETSAINIASRAIYTYVRHVNSGHANYDSPDLMLYLICMDSALMFLSYMKRVVGVLYDYSPLNRYYPDTLLTAMGIDPVDIREHIVDFRGFINQYAVRIGSMCIPNSMSYMARHSWMTEGIYVDSPAAKAQSYMYVPYGYYKFKYGQGSSPAGFAEIETFFNPAQYSGNVTTPAVPLKKFSDVRAFAESLIAPILANEDMNIMSGDILKAFGPEGIVKVTGVMDGYSVLPIYSQEVLSQIENSTILGASVFQAVRQNTSVGGGYLYGSWSMSPVTDFAFPNGATVMKTFNENLTGDVLLNFHHDVVTPEEVMVATRLTTRYTVQWLPDTADGHSQALTLPRYFGSEVVCHCHVFHYLVNSGNKILYADPIASTMMYVADAVALGGTTQYTNQLVTNIQSLSWMFATLSNFDWAPQLYVKIYNRASTNATTPFIDIDPLSAICDIDNYTVLTPDNINNLHEVAILSEFSIPRVGLM